MCSRAGGDLLADVLQHDVRLHDAEHAAVHRHDRAVPAQMLAAARRLGVPDAARCRRSSPAAHTRRAAAGRRGREPGTAAVRARSARCRNGPAARSTRPCSNSPPRIESTPARRSIGVVQRGVQAVRAEVRPRIRGLDAIEHAQEQPRGGVHRQVEGDQVGLLDGRSRAAGCRRGRRR